ncbi:hypothetical protein D3C87_1631750 [compost metagenome]
MHGEFVLAREVRKRIGSGKIENVCRRPHDLPFHFSNGCDARAIFDHRFADAAIGGKVRQIDGRTVRGNLCRRFPGRGNALPGHGMQQARACSTTQKIPPPDPHSPASTTPAHRPENRKRFSKGTMRISQLSERH